MRTKLTKIGGSYGIIINPSIFKLMNISPKSEIEIAIKNGCLTIVPIREESKAERSCMILDPDGKLIKGTQPLCYNNNIPEWGGDETSKELIELIESARTTNMTPIEL